MIKILTVKSLSGETYPAQAQVNRTRQVNGEREISLSFSWSDINADFLEEIETGWQVNFKGDWYHLYSPTEDKHGTKSFDADLDFFHHFSGFWHVDDVDNQSMTIENSIRPLFDGTDYVLNIIDNFHANTMSYSKQQSSAERFLYFIERHNAEFNIPIGTKTVQIRNRIGVRRNDIIIHEDDNLIDLQVDTDTSSFCTAITYYYDFQETDDEGSEKEPTKSDDYISPMAGKHGIYYGEPIHDERYSVKSNAEEAARLKQESTWKTSFTLQASLFDVALNEGDEVPLVYPSKSINMYIRVVEINESFDEDGDLIGAEYTFGNENISAEYRKRQYDSLRDVGDMLAGRKPIPYSVLPKAIREATAIIHAGENSHFYYRRNGTYGYNTENELWVTTHNANGIGFSQDGGQTYGNAITHLGVVTEALTAGTIDANRITIYGSNGTNRIEIDGDKIRVWDSSDPDVYTEMRRGRFHANKGAFSLTAFDGREVFSDGVMRGSRVANIKPFKTDGYLGPGGGSPIYFDGMNWRFPGTMGYEEIYRVDDEYKGRYMDFLCSVGIGGSSSASSSSIQVRFRNWDGDIVGSGTYSVQRGTEPLRQVVVRVDLQAMFGHVPNYRTVVLYCQVRVSGNSNVEGVFRLNRGEFNG